jgi:hypothetical protein
MKKALIILVALVVVGGVAAFIPAGGDDGTEIGSTEGGPTMDLSQFDDDAPGLPIRLLFIHHSVGGTLMADRGPIAGEQAPQWIAESHPNGGGLRSLLTEAGYQVHEASYGSRLGENTDLFDWLPKFRDSMDDILRIDNQDQTLPDGQTNQVVMFKSCFPNSFFVGEGEAPGNPDGPELTLANAQAMMNALREQLAAHPEVLFVYVTAPPMAPPYAQPLWKYLVKRILGSGVSAEDLRRSHDIARQFNNWVRSPEGWLNGYPHHNIVVFDFFDVLTDHGQSNMLRYPTGGGSDSHPATEGTQAAAREFMPLINRAVRYAGLIPGPADSQAEPSADGDAAPQAEAAAEGDAAPQAEAEEDEEK